MVARKPGRYLAPVALIVVLVAVILIVRARTDSHRAPAVPTTSAHTVPASHPATRQQTFYIVKPSDTLSGISVKTGVPVATLETLNPSINLGALQIGQRIRLR